MLITINKNRNHTTTPLPQYSYFDKKPKRRFLSKLFPMRPVRVKYHVVFSVTCLFVATFSLLFYWHQCFRCQCFKFSIKFSLKKKLNRFLSHFLISKIESILYRISKFFSSVNQSVN